MRQLEPLPGDTRQLLLLAAAEPVGDVTLLRRAAELLGLEADEAAPAEAAGLIDIGARVRFRHPLVRSAAYRAASVPDRRDVHRALAEATDPQLDPDRRAWHRAHAAARLDEAVAAELERSAGRARNRGGIAAAAAFLERAAELTPDPARRGRRALAAAQAKFESGAPEAAQELLAVAEMCPLDALQSAQLARLRAQIAFVVQARQRRSAPARRCRQTARSARSRARRARRISRRSERRCTRDASTPTPARGCRGGPRRARGAAAAAIDRPRARRTGHAVHGGTRRGRAAAPARARGVPERGARRSRRDHALAPAVSDRPVDDGVRAVGRRRVPRARHPRGATGSRDRRARPASRRARRTGRACTCSPGSSPRPRRSIQEADAIAVATGNAGARVRPAPRSPPGAASKPKPWS